MRLQKRERASASVRAVLAATLESRYLRCEILLFHSYLYVLSTGSTPSLTVGAGSLAAGSVFGVGLSDDLASYTRLIAPSPACFPFSKNNTGHLSGL